MRSVTLVALTLALVPAAAVAADTTVLAGPHYSLSISLDPPRHGVEIAARITLPPESAGKSVDFLLAEKLAIKTSSPEVTPAPGSALDGFVGINASSAALARRYRVVVPADGVITLQYAGLIDAPVATSAAEYARGFKETTGIIEDRGVYLAGATLWYPNFGQALFTFDLEARAPEGWHLIGVGDGSSRDETGVARWRATQPVDELHIVGGPLLRYTQAAGAIEAQVYLHKADDALASRYLEATGRYIEMYRTLIGAYPYGKFALVENFWETGYGMPSFTLLGPQIIRFPFILTSSYPHEILHNWWGNSVFVDYESGNWCEGLTAYMADHLIKEQQGQGAEFRRDTLKRYRDFARTGGDFPLSKFRSRHSAATEAVGYGKTSMGFHELRRRVGDERFRTALQRFYRENRGKRATFADVRRAFEAVTKEDLSAFFTQWVERTGAPDLRLEGVKVQPRGNNWVVRGTLREQSAGAPFALDLPLVVVTNQNTIAQTVRIEKRAQPFEIVTDARPLLLEVDPEFDVFRVLDARETAPSLGQAFGDIEAIAVIPAKADAARAAAYTKIVETWGGPEKRIRIVRDAELRKLPADRSVWLFGADNRFSSLVSDAAARLGARIGSDTLDVNGSGVALTNHSTVLVTRHPANVDKVIVAIHVAPIDAAEAVASKLPHYGKYSYLAFEDAAAKNVLKGEWQTLDSPLRVDLRPARERAGAPLTAKRSPRPALAQLPPVFNERALRAHVDWLADPAREGRGVGTAGLDAARDYVAEAFRATGLQPAGDAAADAKSKSYLQAFELAAGPQGKPVKLANVVGYLPGSNPAFAGQAVVLSAHYDHLGRGWPGGRVAELGKVHAGADDNASGVAVLLELAKTYAARGAPQRTLIFAAFSGEEASLAGSRHFVAHPSPVALEGIRAVVNLDTVGRLVDRDLLVLATGTATEWPHVFRGVGFTTGVRIQSVAGAAQSSDQQSFIERGIPGVQLFTAAHADYHRPTDTADKIDSAGLVKVALVTQEAVDYLLQRPEPLHVTIANSAATSTPTTPTPAPGRRVSFGMVPEYTYQGRGVKAESIVAGSPAEAAGMQAGDVLVELGGKPIADMQAFSDVLKTFSPGDTVEASWLRGEQKLSKRVTLPQR